MVKNKFTHTIVVTIKVNNESKAAREWADPDQYLEDEVKNALMGVRGKYADWNQSGDGKLDSGTTFNFETNGNT